MLGSDGGGSGASGSAPPNPAIHSDRIQLAQASGGGDAIGTVQGVVGAATLTRLDGSATAAAPGDPVFQDDVVTTAPDGSVSLVFVDGTSFSLGGDAEITLDTLVYNPGGGGNALDFSVAKGAFVFITGSIAGASGEGMEVQMPAGTVGIRGTTVGCGPSGAGWTCALLRDPDGSIGRVVFSNNAGQVILDQPLEASTLPDLSRLPSTPTLFSQQEVLSLFGDALPGLPQVLEQIMTPEAGPEQEPGPPSVPNQGHLLTPFGGNLSLTELAGENGEGANGALGGALGGTVLSQFDPNGQLNSSDLLPAEAPSVPVDDDPVANEVSEQTANGTVVGITALSLDPDGGIITYSLLDDADGRFAIDPATGVVTVADAGRLDFDDTPSYTLIVVATNPAGQSARAPLVVNLLDENDEAPAFDAAGPFALPEGSAEGAVVGAVQASDVDTVGGPVTYSIVSGNDDGYFALDPVTGVITLTADGAAALPDFETTPQPFALGVLGIVASDGVNESAPVPVTINLGDDGPPSAAFLLNEIGVDHPVAPNDEQGVDFIELRNTAGTAQSLRDLHIEIIGQDGAISASFYLPELDVPAGGLVVLVPDGGNGVNVFIGDGSVAVDLAGAPAATIAGAGIGNWNFGDDTTATLGINLSDGLNTSFDSFVANRANPALFAQPSLWTGATPGSAGYQAAAGLLATAIGLTDHSTFNGQIGDQLGLLQALGLDTAGGANNHPLAGPQATLFSRVDLGDSHDASGWITGGGSSIGQLNDAAAANPQGSADIFDPAQSATTPGEGQTVIAAGNDGLIASGGNGPDFLYGGAGDDILGHPVDLESHNDLLFGHAGDDWLFGGRGADLLIDVDGQDLLVGGTGNDTLLANAGSFGAPRAAGDLGDILVGDNLASANLFEAGGEGGAPVGPKFNFVLALDGSGSMVFSFDGQQTGGVLEAQQRLTLGKEAYKALIDRIVAEGVGATTTIKVILFNTGIIDSEVFTLDTASNIAAAKDYITNLTPTGNTEFEPALGVAADFLNGQMQDSNTQNFIYFLGDGADNTGYDSDAPGAARLYNQSIPNLTIRAFGIGTIGGGSVDPDQLDEVVTGINGDNGTPGQPDQSVFISNPDDVANSIVAGSLSGAAPGQDVIIGSAGDDYIFGDNLVAGFTASELEAFLSNPHGWIAGIADGNKELLLDILHIAGVSDDIDGGGGDDMIFGQGGADEIHGGDGDDLIYGGAGNDMIFGDAGADTLYGGAGNDWISVGTGDMAYGEAGSDRFILTDNTGFARIEGGSGGTGDVRIDSGDILVFDGLLDLTAASTLEISGIETISMRETDGSAGGAADRLVLNAADVIALSDATFDPNGSTFGRHAALRVDGDSDDTVALQGGWQQVTGNAAANVPADYGLWVHDAPGSANDAYALVQTTVELTFTAGS